jgi:hypothetical protein
MPRAGATENERRTEKRSKWRGIRSARRSHGSGGPSTDAGPHRKVSFSATMTSGGKAGSPALLRHGSTCALLAGRPPNAARRNPATPASVWDPDLGPRRELPATWRRLQAQGTPGPPPDMGQHHGPERAQWSPSAQTCSPTHFTWPSQAPAKAASFTVCTDVRSLENRRLEVHI